MQPVRVKALALESNFEDEQRVRNLELLCTKFNYNDSVALDQLGLDIATQLSGVERETLEALWKNGPLDPGHLLSKTANEFLCHLDLVQMCVAKGEDGMYVCTQNGHWVYKGIQAILANPELGQSQQGDLLGDAPADAGASE